MSSLSAIKTKIAELQKQADAIVNTEKQAVIEDIKAKLVAYNISIDELQKREKVTKSASRPVKYRKSEHEFWVGRGPKPQWVKDLEEKGENLELYRIPVQITQ
ncbi:MAG: H-NS histone family protein [Chlorobium sp.]|jgi:DNA-binding protein H-NS|nr:MAG: H-NS histone family protein [Chlorobium sp.]